MCVGVFGGFVSASVRCKVRSLPFNNLECLRRASLRNCNCSQRSQRAWQQLCTHMCHYSTIALWHYGTLWHTMACYRTPQNTVAHAHRGAWGAWQHTDTHAHSRRNTNRSSPFVCFRRSFVRCVVIAFGGFLGVLR